TAVVLGTRCPSHLTGTASGSPLAPGGWGDRISRAMAALISAGDLQGHRRTVEARVKEVEQARVRLLHDARALTEGYGT
ncbi:hypothetical protein, partial [Streptomyces sp. NRRL S-481]|uniref:hypothetical protein n=1 Tax=Streptomyces sp. NRRL S-481 TaxID=1463911 RepID=UPI001F171B09